MNGLWVQIIITFGFYSAMQLQSLLNLVPYYLLFTSLAALPQVLSQGTRPPVLDSETDAFINRVLREWNSPGGIAVAFVRRNEQGEWVDIETKGYGRATASGTPVTANTTFNIGSNSKVHRTSLVRVNLLCPTCLYFLSYSRHSRPVF